MGQEIGAAAFSAEDFATFAAQLARETALLRELHAAGRLSRAGPRIGLELEAWLIDRNFYPAPHNQSFLHRLNDPFVVAELSRFNIELNAFPEMLEGEGLLATERHLAATWQRCLNNAHEDVDTVVAIGTLPTLRESDLSLDNMTPSNRYAALNTEMIRLRDGRALRIDIDCHDPAGEHLRTEHLDVMLEAATTSFQLHLQVPPERLAACFNASLVLSAPLLAIAANSPFLFGKPLWHETRVPIFEQAIEQAGQERALHRVTFGTGYMGADPTALFAENLANYPVLLPIGGEDEAKFPCLRLHNGTIWRWNRPLVGFDDDGTPHLRIEFRVMPAGPSVIDMIANAALYYGAVHMLARQ
ncbi:MAG TPA: glutamate-cysteine ligase family protein, partial [Rhodanobacteraceae bacterium]|nr:glutamate-cysteine ligase family protein [Rhodanobacteraceae bacterium]